MSDYDDWLHLPIYLYKMHVCAFERERERDSAYHVIFVRKINEFCISVFVYQNQIYLRVSRVPKRVREGWEVVRAKNIKKQAKKIDCNDISWEFVTISWLNVSFVLFELKFAQIAPSSKHSLTKWWFHRLKKFPFTLYSAAVARVCGAHCKFRAFYVERCCVAWVSAVSNLKKGKILIKLAGLSSISKTISNSHKNMRSAHLIPSHTSRF